MSLNKEQSSLYRRTMEQAKQQLDSVDEDMEQILETTRLNLVELQQHKKLFRQIYESTALILGLDADLQERADPAISRTALLEEMPPADPNQRGRSV